MSSSGSTNAGQVMISDEDLQNFCEFLYRKTGLRFDDKKRYYLERRLSERVRDIGASNFREYLSLLHTDQNEKELQMVVNSMTVNETYFFREQYQFDCLVRNLMPEVTKRRRRQNDRISIWSVPCSTGEEPYSIAIWLLDKWAQADDFEIEIHASDIDSTVLARARRGVYEARALHLVPSDIRKRYFHQIAEERWQIIDELRESIEFSLVNIASAAQTWKFREFDVIFCRNLLIYFDEVSRRQAVEMFYESLSPGGFVCLGHSESMSRISSLFIPRKFPDALVYQKPL
ncbi:Chemotaxis protein methyltransferase 2 [Azospirillaceae bacterium]